MSKQNIGVNFELKFEEIKDINPSFAMAKVAIAYAGHNRNKSFISKEVFEAALPSLFYCPVVGRYDPETDDFGSHDIRVTHDKDGNMEIVNATVPFGVVYGGTQPYWETVTEADGTQREYLYCDIILWKRQYGYERLAKDDTWHQSMEIAVDSYIVDNNGYCIIEKMIYEALTILGTTVEPCFESASVQMKSGEAVSSYRAQFAAMIQELKETEEFNTMKFDFDSLQKEGVKNDLKFTEEVRDTILAEFGYTLDQLKFEITEDMDEAAFRAALEGMKPAQSPVATFASTYQQKREAISNALDPVFVRNADGEVISETCYWLADFSDEFVYVERYQWQANGDTNNDYGRFKYTLTEGEDGLTATIDSEFELMIAQWLTVEENEKLQQSRNAFEKLQGEFEEYKKDYSVKNSDVDELRKFQEERLKADHVEVIDSVLAEFEDLAENPEFIEITKENNAYSYENPEDLKKECFVIRGKAVPVKFAKTSKKAGIRIPIGDNGGDVAKPRYGNLFERF